VAAGITGGELNLKNVMPEHITSVVSYLRESGCRINIKRTIYIFQVQQAKAIDIIRTLPYPGFPPICSRSLFLCFRLPEEPAL